MTSQQNKAKQTRKAQISSRFMQWNESW